MRRDKGREWDAVRFTSPFHSDTAKYRVRLESDARVLNLTEGKGETCKRVTDAKGRSIRTLILVKSYYCEVGALAEASATVARYGVVRYVQSRSIHCTVWHVGDHLKEVLIK